MTQHPPLLPTSMSQSAYRVELPPPAELMEESRFDSTKRPEETTKWDSGFGQVDVMKSSGLSDTSWKPQGESRRAVGTFGWFSHAGRRWIRAAPSGRNAEKESRSWKPSDTRTGRHPLAWEALTQQFLLSFFLNRPSWRWTLLPTDAPWWHHSSESLLLSTRSWHKCGFVHRSLAALKNREQPECEAAHQLDE